MKKNLILVLVVLVIVGAIWYLESAKPASTGSVVDVTAPTSSAERAAAVQEKSLQYQLAKEIVDPTGFINTEPFKLSDLIGKKVILIDFWTYSCINCQRTLPYLKEWYAKYKDKGFVIIGVHTPEFEFEKVLDNVQAAARSAGVLYPIVLDSNMGTWNAYNNQYWPREFLIDIDGYVVHDHIGEGGYDETEKAIQAALKERAQVLGIAEDVDMPITVPHQDNIQAESPETYFGSSRNQYLGNGYAGRTGEQSFFEPQTAEQNTLYLIGAWNIRPEYAETSASVGGGSTGSDRIEYLYQAKSVYLVAGATTAMDVEVLLDSKPVPSSMKGADVFYKNGKSYVHVDRNTLYKIIEGKIQEKHLLEFIISNPGLQAFAFTFG